jgi:hypothetical protein
MRLTRLAAALCCAAFALATPAGVAQETSKDGTAHSDGLSITFEFPGGTNIVVPAAASKVQLPPISLAAAPVHSAIEIVNSLVDQNEWKVHASAVAGPLPDNANQVYVVRVEARRPAQARPDPMMVSSVSSLRFLTVPHPYETGDLCIKAETVLTAVETALAVAGSSKRPAMKYHADSGILVLQGEPVDLQVARDVIDRLERDLKDRKATLLARSDKRPTKAEDSIAKLEADVEKLKAEVAELKKAAGK